MKPVDVAKTIVEEHKVLFSEGQYYKYEGGVYREQKEQEIDRLIMGVSGPDFSISLRNETKAYLEPMAFIDRDERKPSANLLNLANGIFDLSTMSLKPHTPEIVFTSQIATPYIPEASCPRWNCFLDEVLGDDPTKISVLKEFMGYCLISEPNFEKTLMLIGYGANGKSVVLNVLRGVLGKNNCVSLPLEEFKNGYYLAELSQKMVNISTESSSKSRDYETSLKRLVSGEERMVAKKFGHPFGLQSTCKYAFSFNEFPSVEDRTDGFYRRILPIPFPVQIPPERQNKWLSKELLDKERSGILNWMFEGLEQLLYSNEFSSSPSIEELISGIKSDNNNVITFVNEACCFEQDATITKNGLYTGYRSYCDQGGYKPFSKNKFSRMLKKSFPTITEGKSSVCWHWENIKMKEAQG